MAEDLEDCVVCQNPTIVRRDMSIELRQFYIDGVGQLCPECYKGLYGFPKEELSQTTIQLYEIGILI